MMQRQTLSLTSLLSAAAAPSPVMLQPADPSSLAVPASSAHFWPSIGRAERDRVARVSFDAAFPFRTAVPVAAGGIVIARNFMPFPLSIDDRPARSNYNAEIYLWPEGKDGKILAQRGFLHKRSPPAYVVPPDRLAPINGANEVERVASIGVDAFDIDLLTIDSSPQMTGAFLMLDVAWSHYSETADLGPLSFTQFAFYDLAACCTAWFKRGALPPILRDNPSHAFAISIRNALPADCESCAPTCAAQVSMNRCFMGNSIMDKGTC